MMEEENKIIEYGFVEGVLDLDIDANKDGEKVLKLSLNVNEAIQEAVKKGTAVDGAKVSSFDFQGTKLKIVIDTDKDGENLATIEIDLLEAFDEIKDAVI